MFLAPDAAPDARPFTRMLRVEGVAELAVLVALYALHGGRWWLFGVLFLAPDLAMLGYLAGARVGAVSYNAAHLMLGPAVLGVAALLCGWPLGVSLALIWAAHIQFDRPLGYGLKSARGFGVTHLGAIGRGA
jgi:hypothetical protein